MYKFCYKYLGAPTTDISPDLLRGKKATTATGEYSQLDKMISFLRCHEDYMFMLYLDYLFLPYFCIISRSYSIICFTNRVVTKLTTLTTKLTSQLIGFVRHVVTDTIPSIIENLGYFITCIPILTRFSL